MDVSKNLLFTRIDHLLLLLRFSYPLSHSLLGWTYNLLQDGLAMIQCVLDTDTLECNWSKTVLIRSCLENDDPTTFEVIIKSKVPG